MARLFSISFFHEAVPYNSMVSVKTTPFYMEYTLVHLPPDLLLQLPGKTIISPSSKHFLFPNASARHSKELMDTIINAVAGHLQTVSL